MIFIPNCQLSLSQTDSNLISSFLQSLFTQCDEKRQECEEETQKLRSWTSTAKTKKKKKDWKKTT